QPSGPRKVVRKSNNGGVLKLIREGGWSIGKPLLAEYLARKFLKTAGVRGTGLLPEPLIWATAFIKGLMGQSKQERDRSIWTPSDSRLQRPMSAPPPDISAKIILVRRSI